MKTDIIQFETALLARDKGFFTGSNYYYDINTEELIDNEKAFYFNGLDIELIEACEKYELQKWLRDKQRIDITVICDWQKGVRFYKVGLSYVNSNNEIDIWFSRDEQRIPINHATYEIALEEGLKNGLTLIEI